MRALLTTVAPWNGSSYARAMGYRWLTAEGTPNGVQLSVRSLTAYPGKLFLGLPQVSRDDGMHITARKEQFNVAYVGALAAQAGINSAKMAVDNDSVDILFVGKGFPGISRDPQVNFQLKCTHKDFRVGDNIRYPLERKNYDDLRATNLSNPRYLAVLEVPELCDDWTHHLDDGMLLKSKCYWASLKGLPNVDQGTITVSVPLAQRLTSASLLEILTLASERRDA